MRFTLSAILPSVLALPSLPEHWSHGELGKRVASEAPLNVWEAQYLPVALDHFTQGSSTWNLKFFVSDAEFKEGGALILHMPGEGATGGCGSSSLSTALNAVDVCAEHRFFGTSVPNGDSSVSNFRYLSVEQNLADQIALVAEMKKRYPSISKVVASGGSYSGASSAWIRKAYPEVVDAAIAESPPIVARTAFPEYDVSNLVALSSPDYRCASTMAKVSAAIDRQIATNKSATFKLFNAEYQLTSEQGDTDFMYGIGDASAASVQYGQKELVCKYLQPLYNKVEVSDVEYTQVFADYTLSTQGAGYYSTCFYNSTCMRDAVSAVPAEGARSWYWLKCTQLGYFQTAPQEGLATRPRGFNLQAALDQCAYIFPGAELISDASVKAFNAKFGGPTIGGESHIFELDFSDDPWKMSTSVPEVQRTGWSLTLDEPFLYLTCDGCAHCGAGVPADKSAAIAQQKIEALASWGIGQATSTLVV